MEAPFTLKQFQNAELILTANIVLVQIDQQLGALFCM